MQEKHTLQTPSQRLFSVILTTAEEVTALQEALSKRQGRSIGGGLSFELQARKALADTLVGAVEVARNG